MGKKLPYTPRSRVRAALRKLWLWSRERNAAIKNAKGCCANCGVKQSKAKGKEQKVEVHHKDGIKNWEELIDAVYKFLLVHPDKLEVLCPDCHEQEEERINENI